ncbi:hypothetical protein B7700_10165 [Streptococcus mitis]|uniref:DUF308 domain-containing protein n=1 Tax=Streptococcus mitis TaxID=28037 RepID=A0A1X1JXH2_STRMT|nr:hypothetical protein [Streptococcus mitis]ORO91906.1 hypothetical protein B7700_10165 [Streptococcus mitis]
MKNEKLAQIDGIIGLITGMLLISFPFILVLIGKLANDNDAYSAILGIIFIVFSEEVAIIILGTIFIIFSLIKIIILILGIITLIYYKNDNRISFLPSLLLIIGSSIALIPLLGWFGGIIIIIASILFLESLQKFKVEG